MIKRADYVQEKRMCYKGNMHARVRRFHPLHKKQNLHHLADLEVEVSLVSASLGGAIRAGDSSATRLIATQTDLLPIERIAIDSVKRVISNAIAVGRTPDELGGVGGVVVGVLGETEAVALADDGCAEVAAVGCDLHLSGLLAGAGGGEEDVLVAVVLDACVAGEGGGGEGEDAGDEGGGVHLDVVELFD